MKRRVQNAKPLVAVSIELPAPSDGHRRVQAVSRTPRRPLPLEPLPTPAPEPVVPIGNEEETADDETASADPWAVARASLEARPGRSLSHAICPFLRAETADGGMAEPLDVVDERHRCTALAEPLPLSGPQQELLCLTASHPTCPRHAQGLAAASAAIAGDPPARRLPFPIAAAFALLALSASAVTAYLVANGGLALTLPSGPPGPTLAALIVPATDAAPTETAGTPAATPRPTPSTTPTARPTTAPTQPPPSVSPQPSLQPTSPATPRPYAERMRGLDRCPGEEVCYVYVVRSGDNLSSIANYFGSTLDAVVAMNPQIEDPSSIRVGDEIRLPPP